MNGLQQRLSKSDYVENWACFYLLQTALRCSKGLRVLQLGRREGSQVTNEVPVRNSKCHSLPSSCNSHPLTLIFPAFLSPQSGLTDSQPKHHRFRFGSIQNCESPNRQPEIVEERTTDDSSADASSLSPFSPSLSRVKTNQTLPFSLLFLPYLHKTTTTANNRLLRSLLSSQT